LANSEKGVAFLDADRERKPRVSGPKSHLSALRELWRLGMPPGDKTGWRGLDKHYTVALGQFTVITGWPGSGKSEWLDALLVNLAHQGWKFAVFSPENQPITFHISKLMEKVAGKPFGEGVSARIALDELDEYTDELDQSFHFIEAMNGAVSAKDVIDAATPFLTSHAENKRGLIIDPWNELEHWRPPNLSETEYVSQTLSMVRNWARQSQVHVWIVAHPQKMRREDGKLPIPRPDMISGSSHWWNKADNAITVYRDLEKLDSKEVDVIVQKIRFKHIGRPGVVKLEYDRVTGRYAEPLPKLREYLNQTRELV
jgi:twinkle protein